MLSLLHPTRSLRAAAAAALHPVEGATANAAEAVRQDLRAAAARRAAAVAQAEALSPRSWVPLARPALPGAEHAVDLCGSDAEQVARLTSYVVDGLAVGDVCIVVATPAHRAGLHQRLRAQGVVDTDRCLVERDAETVLAGLLRDGHPDAGRFDATVGELVRAAHGRGRAVRAYGEMVGLLASAGRLDDALALERLWERLQGQWRFPLLCAYPAGQEAPEELRVEALAHHSHAVATGS